MKRLLFYLFIVLLLAGVGGILGIIIDYLLAVAAIHYNVSSV